MEGPVLMKRFLICVALLSTSSTAFAQIVISGNENKTELPGGDPRVVSGSAPDNLTILNFANFPPKVQNIEDVRNTVIGPPSNIAITPNGKLALIADSLMIDPAHPDKTIPSTRIHVLDLTVDPAKVIGEVTAGKQPSGMSIAPNGKMALVANRAGGTVSVLSINDKTVSQVSEVKVCLPEDQCSDVAISPDGRKALVSINKAGYVRLLEIDGTNVTATERKFAAFGGPYRVVITPDGTLGLTAGAGFGNPLDTDALTVIDLSAEPPRTIGYVEIGSGPESFEVSPDGELVAVVLMNGSSQPVGDPHRTEAGVLSIFSRKGKEFVKTQDLPIGPVPEGVAFTSDGHYLVVQCHRVKELWIFRVDGHRVSDTGQRIPVPGYPSSLRAGG